MPLCLFRAPVPMAASVSWRTDIVPVSPAKVSAVIRRRPNVRPFSPSQAANSATGTSVIVLRVATRVRSLVALRWMPAV